MFHNREIEEEILYRMARGSSLETITELVLEKWGDLFPDENEVDDYVDRIYWDHEGCDLSRLLKKNRLTDQITNTRANPLKKIATRDCAICGCSFDYNASHTQQKYCSTECSKVANKKVMQRVHCGDQFRIFDRDGCRCQYCGADPSDGDTKLVLDHIIPWSKGGFDTAGNLVTACRRCNGSKLDRDLSEETLMYIQSTVEQRNAAQGIHPDKGIKGSHCRGSEPRTP